MAIYRVQAPDGRGFKLEGDSPPTEQELESVFASLPQAKGSLKPSTQQTLSDQSALEQQIITRAQKPALTKVIDIEKGVLDAITSPFVAGYKAVPGLLDVALEPSKILPTAAEATRRAVLDIGNSVQTGAPALGELLAKSIAANAARSPFGVLTSTNPLNIGLEALRGLKPRTPTASEIQRTIEGIPAQEAFKQEREQVRFEGAQPQVAEAGAEIAPLLIGAGEVKKGVQAITKGVDAISQAPRLIRSAIKPSKAAVGARIERATAEEFPAIFHANPNADTLASTPLEGLASQVKTAAQEAGSKISELRALSGTEMTAGNELADKLLQKAVDLEAAGQPKSMVNELVSRAEDIRGQLTDINSLQEAVTIANRKPNIMKPKSTAEGFADEIIAKEGGNLINQELNAVGGAEGQAIRKKWSNLKTLSDNLEERANKIINNAPEEAQNALLSTLASPEGVAGVFAMVHGWTLPGAVALGSKLVKNWAKNEIKDLKNSNSIIEKLYSDLRKNPPPVPTPRSTVIPPPVLPRVPPTLNEALAAQVP